MNSSARYAAREHRPLGFEDHHVDPRARADAPETTRQIARPAVVVYGSLTTAPEIESHVEVTVLSRVPTRP